MRILQVVAHATGGMAAHTRHVCSILAEAGHDVILAAPASLTAQSSREPHMPGRASVGDTANLSRGQGERWRHIPVEVAAPAIRGIRDIRRLIALAHRADVVHAHGVRASAALALLGIPHVTTWHSVAGGDHPGRVARIMEAVSARGSTVVLGVSTALCDRAKAAGARRVERALIPVPGWEDRDHGDPDRPTHTPVSLVTVARLAPQKGIDLILDTAAILRDEGVDVAWNVLGDGPLRDETEHHINLHHLTVTLAGYCTDVEAQLAAADLYIQTSRSEGQPVAVQEALRAACAVVATNVGGTAEVVGAAALLTDTDPAALARAIRQLIDHPDEMTRRRHLALARSEELPTGGDLLDQLDHTYRLADTRCRDRKAGSSRETGSSIGERGQSS